MTFMMSREVFVEICGSEELQYSIPQELQSLIVTPKQNYGL